MMDFNLDNITRKNIKDLVPYSSARSEFEGKSQIFLDANENSLGSVLDKNFHRYPDPLQKELKKKISRLKKVPVENIFIGNGSDEAIDLLIRAFCEPRRDNILVFPPTYGMYEVCAAINNVAAQKILLTEDFQLNTDNIQASLNENSKLAFVCSPNNPTGNLMSRESIEWLLQNFKGLVIIDEAYFDFAETTSWLSDLHAYPNLVVMQTLSKAWGLAALRLGTAFASKEIIHILNKIKPPYNISGITQQVALDALDNEELKDEKLRIISNERRKLEEAFTTLACIKKVYPSDANFLLVKTTDASGLYNFLVTQNIVVRNRSSQPL
jgi:histidinol-phosphate aminotransferase